MIGSLAAVTLLVLAQATVQQPLILHVTGGGGALAGARVTVNEQTFRTDSQGFVAIPTPTGQQSATVEAKGFVSRTILIAGSANTPIEVALEPLPEFEEEVIVTAARSPTRIQDQPLRVEVIDRDEIEEKALMTPGSVAMLIGETTGLRVQPTAPSLGAANVRIQGLRGRYSQILADGLPLYGLGDSFSLMQIPPLDLAQVEIIKGVASALYGAAALGGVINLVSRRPAGPIREVLLNQTSLNGSDATLWLGDTANERWGWTLIGGGHRQSRRDLDEDGWTDVAGYERAMVRPRLFYAAPQGTTVMVTGGTIVENRKGGTLSGRVAPDGVPFAEVLDTARGDIGTVVRWLAPSAHLVAIRASYGRESHDRTFGALREQGVRVTGFAEASLQGVRGRHTWVLGAAHQHDGYDPRDVPRLRYSFDVPAVFAQDEFAIGSTRMSLSGRLDVHGEYGVLASPRGSVLWRPTTDTTIRVSAGGGAFAPTPFVEDTDETGLSRLLPLTGLEAERAWGGSLDVTRRVGGLELTGTLFASTVRHPVQLTDGAEGAAMLINADGPTRTWGSEALGRYRSGPLLAVMTYALVQARELDVESRQRREVPLTPRHYAALDVMFEREDWGRAGVEVYYVGRQTLDDNPYRTNGHDHVIVGALIEKRFQRVRIFVNAENLGDVRQTRYDSLLRRTPARDGRWTVDAWAPLDGRVINGGARLFF